MSKRILVIDDELDIREVVCLSLEEFGGWQTDSAGSGLAGVEKAIAFSWDAILLDVSMPDIDGFAVYNELQARPKTQAIPVILLTAKVLPSDRERFATLGVAGVIAKPFNPVTVWQQVAQILGWAT
ncbi:response regulator [Nodosilinea sp. LEGE 06152]|uniref:response regulator n=1 Tax=Nodosilinea sp. LEGE 06152 TaxID=2777966 RepID=UPI00187E128D|nr:response regulator [Nodosilinea sp. LEGE 06152]MBE9158628.1 response regulator [Nodosilinea sp. LEGE 06152]